MMHLLALPRSFDSWMGKSRYDHFRSLADNFVADLAAQKFRARQLRCLLKVVGGGEHALCAVRILTEGLCSTNGIKTVYLSDQCIRLCLIHLAGSLWLSKELDEIIVKFLLSPTVAECLQQNLGVIYGDICDESLTGIKWAALLNLCSIEATSSTLFASIALHQAVSGLRKISELFESPDFDQLNHDASTSFWCLQCILNTLSAVLMVHAHVFVTDLIDDYSNIILTADTTQVSNPKFYLSVEQCQLLPLLAKLLSTLASKNSAQGMKSQSVFCHWNDTFICILLIVSLTISSSHKTAIQRVTSAMSCDHISCTAL